MGVPHARGGQTEDANWYAIDHSKVTGVGRLPRSTIKTHPPLLGVYLITKGEIGTMHEWSFSAAGWTQLSGPRGGRSG